MRAFALFACLAWLAGSLGVPFVAQPADKDETAAWRADLKVFAEELPRRHGNLFHAMTREQFASAVSSLEQRLPELQRHQIIVELARIVARIGDGHSFMPLERAGFRYYPVRYYVFNDGLYVIAADRRYADAVGGRVVRLGRLEADEALKRVAEVVPRDNAMGVKWLSPVYLMMPEVLHALGITAELDEIPLVVERDGRRTRIDLAPAGKLVELQHVAHNWFASVPGWVDARDSAPAPLWLEDPTNSFWYEYLPDSRTVYVQYNAVRHKPEETVGAFFQRVLQFVDENPVDRLVIDARLNGGGNNYLNRPIWHAILRSSKVNQPGKLFVIIGRNTFSAAQNFVNQMELNTHAIFVGEPTGASPNHFGDNVPVQLPNSGVEVRVSSLWWQDLDPRDRRPWRAPDLTAELSSRDYVGGIDPAMRTIFEYVSRPPIEAEVKAAVLRNDVGGAERALRAWIAEPVNKYGSAESRVNTLGYALVREHAFDAAIEVFAINTRVYPDSANTWDSLAEAQMEQGLTTEATRNYEKSLQLNPRNGNAVAMLQRLRGGEGN